MVELDATGFPLTIRVHSAAGWSYSQLRWSRLMRSGYNFGLCPNQVISTEGRSTPWGRPDC